MPKPDGWSGVVNATMSGNQVTQALIAGKQWSVSTLTYSFPSLNNSTWSLNSTKGYGEMNTNSEPWIAGYSALLDSQQGAVRNALASWAGVSGLAFKEVNDNATVVGDLRFAFANGDLVPDAQAWAYLPNSAAYAGDIWFSSTSTSKSKGWWSPGSYEYMTAIHEIGHALGLKHPFDDKPGNTTNLPPSLDSRMYTVMSYSAFGGQKGSYFSYEPTTPMVVDIMTIQHMYGADMNRATGNNTYLFDEGTKYNKTLWDSGGVDEILYAGHDSARIDLREGYSYGNRMGEAIKVYSETGAMIRSDVNNIWIAFKTVIENAQGGYGNDLIFGNNVNNILSGLRGNDTISGGWGRDTISGGDGNDRINGGLGADILTGGDGRDAFIFNTVVTPTSNLDNVTYFSKGYDRLELDNAIFPGPQAGALKAANFAANAAGKAQDANDFIVYETDTGKLFYDADGNGSGAAIQFAIIGNRPPLAASDFLIV